MDIDDKDLAEASDDSSSGPEEIENKDAKEVAVTSIKAEFASQRSLKEKAKKMRRQIEIRNIEQKKTKEAKKKAEDDSSPPKPENSDVDDKADVSLEVEKTNSEKPKKSMKAKKNKTKSAKNLGNNNDKRDSTTGNSQADLKSDSVDKDGPKKLTGSARKRERFNKASRLGKVMKNKLVKSSVIKTEKNTRPSKKFNRKTKNPKSEVVKDNNSAGKAHGQKRKLKETSKDMPKNKSMKKATVKTERTN